MLERWREGSIISETHHKHWSDAFDENVMTADDRDRNVIRRDTWPSHVRMEVLQEDFLMFARSRRMFVSDKQVATAIRQVLPKAGEVKMIRVKQVDQRTGSVIQKRARVHPVPSMNLCIQHLERIYPSILKGEMDELRDEEGTTYDAAKPAKDKSGGKF
jgi:hypothetical protein